MQVIYHLPGLFEFQELYKLFLPLFFEHREFFYDWCEIGSIYGAPADCLWGGGRVGFGSSYSDSDSDELLEMMSKYGISARLTFSNSLLREEHLANKQCNELCERFARGSDHSNSRNDSNTPASPVKNGVILHSDLLLNYIKERYPALYAVSSTTKVITDFDEFTAELNREDFRYVVPDFRLNKKLPQLAALSQQQKDKVEFLCNECCFFGCQERKRCYESVSRKALGEDQDKISDGRGNYTHRCASPNAHEGYIFSKAMKNPGFIGIDDIQKTYMPMGFRNFKIEGRSLGSALILEFLLYYLTKLRYQLQVREAIYLDSSLDLF